MRNRIPFVLAALSLAGGCAAATAGGAGGGDTFDLVVVGTTDTHGRLRGWTYESNAPDPVRGL